MKPIGPYSVSRTAGNLVFVSGQISDPSKDIKAQTSDILSRISTILEGHGLALGHVVKTTVFMTDLKDFDVMNSVYATYFKEPYPARSTIEVSALPKGVQIEIEVIASLASAEHPSDKSIARLV